MKSYRVPAGMSGSINRGTESFPIIDGVVELPSDLGQELGWPLVVDAKPSIDERRKQLETPAAKVAGQPEPNPVLTMNATEACAHVASIATLQELEVAEAAERSHPKNANGRISVLRAIDERRKQLETPAN